VIARHLLVLGSINTDLVIRGPRLPRPGETVLGGEFYESPGGKGANQAVAAARAAGRRGPRVTFLGSRGDDAYGRAADERLRAEAIDCQHLKVAADQASGVALILVGPQGENLIGVAPGANAHLSPDDIDAVPQSVFDNAGVFLASLESPLAAVRRGLERAKAAGVLTIVNPAPAVPEVAMPEFLKLVDVLTPNESEAALLAGGQAMNNDDLPQLALSWQSLGCPSAVFTLGSRGALVVSRAAGTIAIAGHAVQAVDTTAAGDAFNGALAVALCEGRSLAAAADWANRAAALSVTRRGAQPSLPGRQGIERFTT
jgi:ribokinase